LNSLARVRINYFLFAAGGTSGPELNSTGLVPYTTLFRSWTPLGAVQTANGYDVAWKLGGANAYTMWVVDTNGNYVSDTMGLVSGTSFAWGSAASVFGQDLNGVGVVGLNPTLIAPATSNLG